MTGLSPSTGMISGGTNITVEGFIEFSSNFLIQLGYSFISDPDLRCTLRIGAIEVHSPELYWESSMRVYCVTPAVDTEAQAQFYLTLRYRSESADLTDCYRDSKYTSNSLSFNYKSDSSIGVGSDKGNRYLCNLSD